MRAAGGAGRGGAALIDHMDCDPGDLRLVPKRGHQGADRPVVDGLVLSPPRIVLEQPAGIADHKRADLLLDRPGNDLASGLVPGRGALPALARARALPSARCSRCSARSARPDTSNAAPEPSTPARGAITANGWMMPRSTPATRAGSGAPPGG